MPKLTTSKTSSVSKSSSTARNLKTPTTDMQVTSIRFDRELIETLKQLAGGQGYQSLIREVLWDYVRQRTGESQGRIQPEDIRARVEAIADSPQQCALTGQLINPQERMQLALLRDGQFAAIALQANE